METKRQMEQQLVEANQASGLDSPSGAYPPGQTWD
jgi:hypothetical protein